MKKFYLFVLFLIIFKISFSAPVITAIASSNWNLPSTWNLNRLPQVGDTIIIPSGKTVTINDDQDLNGFVFIKINGKLGFQNNNSTLSIKTPSVIIVFANGQILGGGSASQKIRYDNSAIFQGDEASINGPEMASASSIGFTSFASSPLPVKFVGFTLTHKGNDVFIQWSTSEEINADMYQVERSVDGTCWNTIAYVAATGNSSAVNNYSFTDRNISAKIAYYRIKEIDLGGQVTYTSVKSVKSETASATEIKIAAVQNKLLLQFAQELRGNFVVRFVSKNGQVVDQQTINNPVGQVVLNSKLTGNYIISISNGQDINTAKQVIL